MSRQIKNKSNKISQGFRLETRTVEALKGLCIEDPLIFSSYALVIDAALDAFTHLSREKQIKAIRDYLTRNLK